MPTVSIFKMFFSSHTAPSRNISTDKLFITFLSVFCFPGRFSEVKLAHDQHMMTLYDVKMQQLIPWFGNRALKRLTK